MYQINKNKKNTHSCSHSHVIHKGKNNVKKTQKYNNILYKYVNTGKINVNKNDDIELGIIN